jgi:EAL domain-containing protein (putative c-di-GMP-specific phosphodiesterase class I)/CRP-like cAMP-binding protein
MLTNGNRQSVAPGQVIFAEGEAGDCAYLIESGIVEISTSRASGSIVLARLHAGDLFGEMALIDHGVRSATARALEATTLAVIRRDQVLRKMDAADPLIKLFLRVLLRRLRETSSRVDASLVSGAMMESEQTRDDTGFRRLREQAMGILEREQRLEEALWMGEFKVFFQPMVELATGRAAGFEALLRWHQPDGTVLEAEDFIGLAGDIGLMGELTRLVLERACAAIMPLQERVGRRAFMSLNLSARQLGEPEVIEEVLAALQTSGVTADHLLVEVTEGVLIDDPVRVGAALRRLKVHGVSAGVDDFGTGYSSLSCLQRFPIDVLKLDRSFVAALADGGGSPKIVRAIARLSQELGLVTVAEGIERVEELALIRELGYDLGQGFLFAPALPLDEAMAIVGTPFFDPASTAFVG